MALVLELLHGYGSLMLQRAVGHSVAEGIIEGYDECEPQADTSMQSMASKNYLFIADRDARLYAPVELRILSVCLSAPPHLARVARIVHDQPHGLM